MTRPPQPRGKLQQPAAKNISVSTGSGGGSYTQRFARDVYTAQERVTLEGTPPDPPAVALPTSQTGILVPYIIGRQRVTSPNVIWYGNLRSRYEYKTEVKTEKFTEVVSRGMLDFPFVQEVIRETVTVTKYVAGYNLDVQMGLCLGPDVHLREVFRNNVSIWSGNTGPARSILPVTNDPFIKGGLIYQGGNFDQLPDPHLVSVIPTGVPGYVGLAYIILRDVEATGTFPAMSCEVERFPNPLGLAADINREVDDINIATAAFDVLTNPWGAGGISPSKIHLDSFNETAEILAAEHNFCSLYIQQAQRTSEILKILTAQADGTIFVDPTTDQIGFKLFRKSMHVVENLPVFNPDNVTTVREFSKGAWEDTVTKFQATYTSRKGNYSQAALTALNPVVGSTDRAERVSSATYPASMTSDNTSRLITRDLSYVGQPLPGLVFQANRDAADLLPGDGIRFTWPEWDIEDELFAVLNRKVSVDSDNQTILTLKPLIDPITTIVFAPDEDSLFDPPNPNPVAPEEARLISAPYWISARSGYTADWSKINARAKPIYLVDRFNSAQVSFDAYMDNFPNQGLVSLDSNRTYATLGSIADGIAQFEGINNGIIAEVEINDVIYDDALVDVGLTGVREGRVFLFVNDEVMSFESCENNGAGSWTLTNVHRALLDTAPQVHNSGSRVYIINNAWTELSQYLFVVPLGITPAFRFVSKSLMGTGTIDSGFVYSGWIPDDRIDRPLRPHRTFVNGSRTSAAIPITRGSNYNIHWSIRSRSNVLTVALTSDASETLEEAIGIGPCRYRVFIKDSANTTHDCGLTSGSGDNDDLTITVPLIAAAGTGVLWVQAEFNGKTSLYKDEVPVNLL